MQAAANAARAESIERMPVFTNLARAALFLDALQQEALEPLGISFGDFAVLRVLDLAGPSGSMSPSRLAETVVRTTGGMTKTIDRLERLGHVSRRPDPTDRRGVLVRLTPKGRRLCTKASESYTAVRYRLLDQLADDEIDRIDDSLGRLLAIFELDHHTGEA